MRVHGSQGALPIECINPPKNRWAVRWDFLPVEDEELNYSGLSYEEAVFEHEPSQDEIEAAKRERMEQLRAGLAARIAANDAGGEVNGFGVEVSGAGRVDMWLNREERSALRIRFEAEQRAGIAHSTLWAPGGLSLTISPAQGLAMLDAVELYAAACYDRTQQHLLAAASLASRAECEQYGYTAGYPDKLTFNI